ncbi:protein of unknown function [Bradyrhizobium vignae]|uniref:Uncharacterized protein n=1 Tax=Bradyrhizobium vignae TaxID=1549949 RepID=A0A2U3PRS1_9BRAD|nr:protein of unknown function [Bradyrhizobium vignae]
MSYRSSWMTEELDVFRDQFRKYLAKDLAPHAEKMARAEDGRPLRLARARRDGRAAGERARGIWRLRCDLRL